MSVVSGFFKLSVFLRNIHALITEEHGIPTWGSYLLFGVATIVVGAILGLILVFLIDCFYPAKAPMNKREEKPSAVEKTSANEEVRQLDIFLYYLKTSYLFRRMTKKL